MFEQTFNFKYLSSNEKGNTRLLDIFNRGPKIRFDNYKTEIPFIKIQIVLFPTKTLIEAKIPK